MRATPAPAESCAVYNDCAVVLENPSQETEAAPSALRRVYGQSRLMTTFKTIGLVLTYLQLAQIPLGVTMLLVSLRI